MSLLSKRSILPVTWLVGVILGIIFLPPIHCVMYTHEGAVIWDSRDPLGTGRR